MRDFTLTQYSILLESLIKRGFNFRTFLDSFGNQDSKVIILRHDVDRLPSNSLTFARIECEKGISGSYYFRSVPTSFNEKIIKQISEMGHEVGYHYEDLSIISERHEMIVCSKYKPKLTMNREEELASVAIESFSMNLERLRKLVPIKTICMHGSPLSKWDNRLLWKYYDYRDFGIIGEPYFDINFDEVLYLTDTGRRWDGDSFNIRDRSINHKEPIVTSPRFHSTFDIIKTAESNKLPDKIMMTFHPQRWTNKQVPWIKELMWQNIKNAVKYFLIKMEHTK